MPVLQVNTRQQTERVAKKGTNSPAHQLPAAGGTLIQIFQVIKNEGFGGLYSGLRPSLMGTAASQVAAWDQLFPPSISYTFFTVTVCICICFAS